MKYVVHTPEQLERLGKLLIAQFIQHCDKGLIVEFSPFAPPRTPRQNGKLHAMIAELAKHLGYDFDELKFTIKEMYGPRKQSILDPDLYLPKSWGDLTKEEANALIERLYQLGADHGFTFKETNR